MMKKFLSAVIFCCAMTTAVNAQNAVKDLLKSAEKKAKLADKNPKNGKMQYQAAMAFIDDALGEEKDYDRAKTYAYRAYNIAQEHPVLQDTLKGLSCNVLSQIYMGMQSWDNAYDFMDMTMDAFEEELGKFDPLTNAIKLSYGNLMLKAQPLRAFHRIQEAFYNDKIAPQNMRIGNIRQAGIVEELGIEMYIAEMAKLLRHCVPRVYVDCQPYYIVQTPDWNVGRPLMGWLYPQLLRTESEKAAAYQKSPIIVCDEHYQFKVISEEEKDKYELKYFFDINFERPRHLDFRDCSSGIIFLPTQADYDRLVTKYREFKAANKLGQSE